MLNQVSKELETFSFYTSAYPRAELKTLVPDVVELPSIAPSDRLSSDYTTVFGVGQSVATKENNNQFWDSIVKAVL
jgi:hypothetical protein